jgi:ribose transport system ATP-binding protein
MKILSGAYRADAGVMRLFGQPYVPRDPHDGRRAGIAMIYQELSLAPHLSIAENILLGIEPVRGPLVRRGQMRAMALQAMAQVGLEGRAPGLVVSRLPIAEQQLVEIARAVAVGCRILVMDEPTSSLTQKDIECLFALVQRLKRSGLAIVYISHFLEEVKRISDRYIVLRDGQSVGEGQTAEATTDRLVALMVGRSVRDLYPRSPRPPGEVVLEVKDLAGVAAPRRASLALRRGEILGLAGLVGAGRTELVRALFGLDPVRCGAIRVATFTGCASTAERWRQGLGMVSEDRKREGLAVRLSVADNLTLSRLTGLGPVGLVLPSRQSQSAQRWIDRIGIKCRDPWQPLQSLSGGNQQKVALARLLHHDVDVLLLDEPTRGIDVGSKAEIYRLMNQLALGDPGAGVRPKAVLLVSSYLPELLGVCDRIAVMTRGILHPARPVREWDEHSIMLEATGAGGDLTMPESADELPAPG